MAKIRLRGGQFTRDRRLDRLVSFDEKSRQFPVRSLIAETARPRSYSWACNLWLDQGTEGACTGFGTTHEAASKPVVVTGLSNDTAYQLYRRAQQLDEWPGEDYEGSSVLGAIKAGKERGWYKEYRWAFGIDDLIMAIGHKGPAILGVNWYEGMFDPDENGLLVPGTTRLAGGHAICANAVDVRRERVKLHNSWGKTWGINGEAYVTFKDLDRLLREDGEACIPTIRLLPKPVLSSVKAA